MHAAHQHGGVWKQLYNLSRGEQTIHPWQETIHQHDRRTQVASHLDCIGAVSGITDHGDRGIIFDDAAECAADEYVVINKQDPDRFSSHAGSRLRLDVAAGAAPAGRTLALYDVLAMHDSRGTLCADCTANEVEAKF
jgi:hypothetical protein